MGEISFKNNFPASVSEDAFVFRFKSLISKILSSRESRFDKVDFAISYLFEAADKLPASAINTNQYRSSIE